MVGAIGNSEQVTPTAQDEPTARDEVDRDNLDTAVLEEYFLPCEVREEVCMIDKKIKDEISV